MAHTVPDKFLDLLQPETKAFAQLALVLADGTPQVTPIWFGYDTKTGLFTFNTARGRLKDRVMARHPVVAFAISDPQNPYRYLQVRGPVVEETEERGYEQICDLNEKYQGNRNYTKNPGEVRVTYRVQPERFQTMG
ncbi:MAG: TIGR03618 family F420-dependent PPOX class oxidoreductase [Chloroflexi bacterium]|nr:TIGR03618 family F420-dependent PPOX class oxidoreductase [Chloroflexota bacterium]